MSQAKGSIVYVNNVTIYEVQLTFKPSSFISINAANQCVQCALCALMKCLEHFVNKKDPLSFVNHLATVRFGP